jgi:hypothetical protein
MNKEVKYYIKTAMLRDTIKKTPYILILELLGHTKTLHIDTYYTNTCYFR